jgi:ribosomal protein S18 acetylase RimI-like enzyme
MIARFRRAGVDDAAAIAATHCASWRTTYPGLVPQIAIDEWANETARTAMWAKKLNEGNDTVWLALDGVHQCLGFVAYGSRRTQALDVDAQIYALYCLQSAQGRGIGKALLHLAMRALMMQGYQSACVEALRGNAAEDFYRHLGARFVRADAFEMSGCPLVEHVYIWPDLQSAFPNNNIAPQV